jgi:uncharacterized protein (DUF1330 family)
MSAIMISDLTIRDTEAFQIYRSHAAPAIAKFGGRSLARNGAIHVLEGEWNPHTVVVVEFPSMEQAKAWYASPEYAEALKVRDVALTRNLILVASGDGA